MDRAPASRAAAAAAAAGDGAGRDGVGVKRRCPTDGGKESDARDGILTGIQQGQRVIEALKEMLTDLEQREVKMGGTAAPDKPSGELLREVLQFNLSGEPFSARRSALCAAKGSVLAVMYCGKFDAAFIRDEKNRIFLMIHAPAFKWLVGELIMYEGEQIETVALPPSKQKDAPYKYWAELLLSDPSAKRRATHDSVAIPPAQEGQQGMGGEQPKDDALCRSLELTSIIKRAMEDKAAQEARLEAIRPLLKTGNSEEDSLVSIEVSGATVTVTKAVATSLGDDSTFANRFLKYDPLTVEVPIEYVQRVVDIVARAQIKGAAPTALDVHGAQGELAPKAYRHALTMYGLAADRFLGPADALLTTDHLQQMRDWTPRFANRPNIPPCVGEPVMRIYKATVDGWRWLDFFDAVKGHSPLLLIFRVADGNELFASLIKGPIEVTGAAETNATRWPSA